MLREMREDERADLFRKLVGAEMAAAGKHFEAVGCGDEIPRALGGDPSNGVVGIAPDVERRNMDRTERAADRGAW